MLGRRRAPLPANDAVARRKALWKRRLRIETKRKARWRRWRGQTPPQRVVKYSVIAILKVLGLYERGRRNADAPPIIYEVALEVENLPQGFDGFRILHLGDFHFDGRIAIAEAIAQEVAKHDVDLVAYTGDSIFDDAVPYEAMYACARQVFGAVSSRHGILACLGNNDYSDFVAPLNEMGLHWLTNEHTRLERGDAALYVAGVDDPHRYCAADLDSALAGAPVGASTILLAHTPELAAAAAARGVAVYLTGHTHGGQLCLPGGAALYKNCRCPRDQVKGAWGLGMMAGYTTPGLGCTAVNVRYNCPPAISLITLRQV